MSWPWLYVNIKFRPNKGVTEHTLLEEQLIIRLCVWKMYLKAGSSSYSGIAEASKALEDKNKTSLTASRPLLLKILSTIYIQKGILGGIMLTPNGWVGNPSWIFGIVNVINTLNMDGVFVGWTPGWNQAN